MATSLQQPTPYISKAWGLDTQQQACKRSNDALLEHSSLSHFLLHFSVKNLFLINGFVHSPFLVESSSVGEGWGTDDMMLDLAELVADKRMEYLHAAANFPGAVYLVDIQLRADEAFEWWEALRLARTSPKSLFFLYRFLECSPVSTFYVDSDSKTYPNAGYAFAAEHLMGVLNRNKGIKNLTVYKSNIDFNQGNMIAGITSLHSLHLEEVVVSHDFLEALIKLENPSSCIKKLTLSSLRNERLGFLLVSRGSLCPWNNSFHRLLKWKLEELALIDFNMGILDLMDFMQNLKSCSNSSLYSLSLGRICDSLGFSILSLGPSNITEVRRKEETSVNVGALVDALDQSGLPFLDLGNFPLDAAVEAQLLRNQQRHSNILKQQLHRKVPATALRLFICGDAYAGKTTLLSSLYSLCYKKPAGLLGKACTCMSVCFSPHEVLNRTQGIEVRPIVRDGIQLSLWDMAGQQEFHAFHDYMFPDLSTSMGSPAMFMFVWSPIESKDGSKGEHKAIHAFEASFGYWLKFIASKTRQSNVARKVIVVFTRKDQMNLVSDALSSSINAIASKFQEIVQVVEVFEVDARDQACIQPLASCIFDTARDVLQGVEVYHTCTEVSKYLSSMLLEQKSSSKQINFLNICTESSKHLCSMLLKQKSPSKSQQLIITWSEFGKICKDRFNITDSEVQKAIACSLNECGDIIYLSNMGYVVLDPNWFCHEVMGSLIHFPESHTSKAMAINGYANRKFLEGLLEMVTKSKVKGSVLVDLMEAMHLSCNVPNGTIFIPATLSDLSTDEYAGLLHWRGESTRLPKDFAYMGRRLECDKKDVTFLTPGLFPMIQVVFNKAFCEIDADVKLGRHVISVCMLYMEIIVAFGLAKGEHVIDVLVRARNQEDITNNLSYVEEEIIRTLIRVCAQPVGIQGVKLVEGVIRPDCLHDPAAPHVREDQCVSVYDLKQKLRKQLQEGRPPESILYLWKENQHVKPSTSSFIELLGFEGYMEVLMSYKMMLEEMSKMGNVATTSRGSTNESKQDKQGRGRRGDVDRKDHNQIMMISNVQEKRGSKRFTLEKEGEPIVDMLSKVMARAIMEEMHKMHAKLDGLHHKMDSMHEDIKGQLGEMHKELLSLRKDVLPKIAKTIEKSLYFAVESEAGKIPRFVFLTTDKLGFTRKLVTSLLKDLQSVRIELFCEHRLLPHRVDGQKGIVLTSLDDTSLLHKALPYVNGFLGLLTLVAKVGAHVVAGAGSAVPDLSGILKLGLEYSHGSLGDIQNLDSPSLPTSESFKGWQKCLVSVLKRHGGVTESNIAHKFSLRRALYKDTYQVAWLCDTHYKEQRPFPLV